MCVGSDRVCQQIWTVFPCLATTTVSYYFLITHWLTVSVLVTKNNGKGVVEGIWRWWVQQEGSVSQWLPSELLLWRGHFCLSGSLSTIISAVTFSRLFIFIFWQIMIWVFAHFHCLIVDFKKRNQLCYPFSYKLRYGFRFTIFQAFLVDQFWFLVGKKKCKLIIIFFIKLISLGSSYHVISVNLFCCYGLLYLKGMLAASSLFSFSYALFLAFSGIVFCCILLCKI